MAQKHIDGPGLAGKNTGSPFTQPKRDSGGNPTKVGFVGAGNADAESKAKNEVGQ